MHLYVPHSAHVHDAEGTTKSAWRGLSRQCTLFSVNFQSQAE
jgi:hypothetical protein